MPSRTDTLVVLTPAFPASEQETHWVPSQQLFVKTLREQYPQLNIIILSLYYPAPAGHYTWKGAQVMPFDGSKQRKWRRPLFWRRIWKQLNRLRRDNEVIGIFSFWCGECALLGHYFGRRYGIKHYCWICGQDARESNTMVRYIRPRPEELVAMSDSLADEFQRHHGIRPRHMIPNAIDTGLFPALAAANRDIDILGVGSLSKLKRYDLFTKMIKALQLQIPTLKAMHCGDGGERANINALIQSSALEPVLSLQGEQPHRAALALMQRSRVFLHTSEYEGFPAVCLEALYAGAHVISFCRPMRQDIPHWHIVTDSEAMFDKAIELLLDAGADYTPVLVYTMDATVKAVMALYGR